MLLAEQREGLHTRDVQVFFRVRIIPLQADQGFVPRIFQDARNEVQQRPGEKSRYEMILPLNFIAHTENPEIRNSISRRRKRVGEYSERTCWSNQRDADLEIHRHRLMELLK